MPFPCPLVFEEIFSLYDLSRQMDRKSLKSRAKHSLEILTGFFTHKDPVITQIETIKNEIKSELKLIEKIKNQDGYDEQHEFEAWFELIFKLAEKAEKAQGLKYPSYLLEYFHISSESDKESLFCQTLHLLRSYVIFKLTENNDQCKLWYTKKLKMIEEAANSCEETLTTAVRYDKGRNIEKLSAEREGLTLQLAILGDAKAIVNAKAYGCLKYLSTYNQMELLIKKNVPANDANLAAPYCLQKNFHLIHYHNVFQFIRNISFLEFEKITSEKYIHEQQKTKEEKENLTHQSYSPLNGISLFNRSNNTEEMIELKESEVLSL